MAVDGWVVMEAEETKVVVAMAVKAAMGVMTAAADSVAALVAGSAEVVREGAEDATEAVTKVAV